MPSSLLEKIKKHGPAKSARLFATLVWNDFTRKTRRLFLNSYSQFGEDLEMERLLGRPKNGFYVDVGANNPVIDSNTLHFYKKGWRGINIEPNYVKFREFVSARPRDINLNIGVGNGNGKMDFYIIDPSPISTFSRQEAEKCERMGHKIMEVKKVEMQPLSSVFAKHAPGGKVDFLSVDTEGYDLLVLQSNDWQKFRPRLVCVEYVGYADGKEDMRIREFLESHGYEAAYSNGVNCIYRDTKA